MTDEALGIWKTNFDYMVSAEDGITQYKAQEKEVDARKFAGQ